MLDAFKLIAILVASILWGAWLVLVLREKDVHPFRDTLEGFGRLGWMKKVGVLFLVVQMTMFGGAKHGGANDVDDVTGTNEVEIVGGGGQSNLTSCAFGLEVGEAASSPLPQTDELSDFTRGYRLECVTTNNCVSYAMPIDGAIRGTWHLTGAYEDVQKVSLVPHPSFPIPHPFLFPLGNNLCSSLWAYTWGKVRPQLKNATNEIVAVGAPMSAIPFVSRFWTAATTNDTYLLTWENFTFGRVPVSTNTSSLIPHPSSLVSAQLELSRNGDFITRSNNVESVYRRVIEPNPIGPVNPPDPEDPTMPIRPYGPVQDLSVINETNAYCWVDIVVNNADAWVRFEGDGPSNLADPSFAAKAGETNHVVILIGKTYKVTCDMDFSVIAKSDPSIEERWEDDHTLWLNWPVTIEAWEGNGNSFRMHVVPGCLGGTFAWTESDCPLSGSGMFFSYSCDTNSLCSGCAARGHYDYEGYAIDCTGGWCGCNCALVEPEVPEAEPDDGPYAGGASVSFSEAAVIFEDGYANMPGEFVPRRSTRTTLSCVAHGGPNGGAATFSISGDDKLVRVSGRSLPVTVTVPPEQKVAFEIVYEGKEPSGSERDIVATATFTEEDGQPSSSDAFLTSVKVELSPVDVARDNESASHRHLLGVHEWVNCHHYPESVSCTFEIPGGGSDLVTSSSRFFCPWTGGTYWVRFNILETEYETAIDVIEPVVVCHNVWHVPIGVNGQAGLLDMRLALYVEPTYVSFKDLNMVEVPDNGPCRHDGYFSTGNLAKTGALSHTQDAGAGKWGAVKNDASWKADEACRRMPYPQPWIQGIKEWRIPIGWGDYNGNLKGTISPDPTTQVFTIDSYGTSSILKFNHEIRREINNRVWLDGVECNGGGAE